MIVGLDFGTATCRGAAIGATGPEPVGNRFDARRLPVYVTLAGSSTRKPGTASPCLRFEGLKQKIGIEDHVPGPSGREPVATVLTTILAQIRDDLQSHATGDIEGVVATVSGVFSERPRAALRGSLLRAGFPAVRLVDEAIAAVLGDGVKATDQGQFLVYALGAGFFSATVIQVVQGVPRMLAVDGARDIGGYACDAALACLLLDRAGAKTGQWLDDGAPLRLQALIEPLRIGLSRREQEEIDLDLAALTGDGAPVSLSITRDEFESAVEGLLRRTIALSHQALASAGVAPAALTGGLMIGGATRMPMVERLLRDAFACPWRLVGEQAIAGGAAVFGQRLTARDWTTDEPQPAAPPPAARRGHERHAAAQAPAPAPTGSWLQLFADPFVEAEALWRTDRAASFRAFEQGLAQAHQLLGNLLETQGTDLLRAGRYAEGVEWLHRAHEASPNDTRITHSYHVGVNGLARHLFNSGDLAGARDVIRVGLALDRRCDDCQALADAIDTAIRDRRGGNRGSRFGRHRRGR